MYMYTVCESVNCVNGIISCMHVQYQLLLVFNCDKHVFHYYYTTDTINTV